MVFICFFLQLYSFVILARMILSWIPVPAEGGFASVYRFIFVVTEPPLAAIRSVVPPVRLGTVALDLSPVILLIALSLLISFICH
jgi:YggT family protein